MIYPISDAIKSGLCCLCLNRHYDNITSMSDPIHFNKSESWQMFNTISPKYDLLNRLLSFGLDIHWRNRLISMFPKKDHLKALDLATGTADVLLSLAHKKGGSLSKSYGVDMAEKMLEIGRKKIIQSGFSDTLELKAGDASKIPFYDDQFDAASISFGIRNVEHPIRVLEEMNRVLKPGAPALILEFSLPKNPIIRFCHLFYLRYIVPIIGWIFSGNYKAYKYLNQTIEKFPFGDDFLALMAQGGLKNTSATELLFGTATIYRGEAS